MSFEIPDALPHLRLEIPDVLPHLRDHLDHLHLLLRGGHSREAERGT